jgi:hypothetical protein
MASSSADDPELLGALSVLAALGIGGIAIWLVEMELGEICWIPSIREGRKWCGPARGRGEYGNGLALREVEEGVIVIQTCNEGLCCSVCKPGLVLLFPETLFGDCHFADMSVVSGMGLDVEVGSEFGAVGTLGKGCGRNGDLEVFGVSALRESAFYVLGEVDAEGFLDAPEEGNVSFRDFFRESPISGVGMSDGSWAAVFPVDFCGGV